MSISNKLQHLCNVIRIGTPSHATIPRTLPMLAKYMMVVIEVDLDKDLFGLFGMAFIRTVGALEAPTFRVPK